MRKTNDKYRFGAAEFKKLQDEWYQKLRSIGFPDIEKDECHVKQYSSNAYRQAAPLERQTRAAYYTAMEHAIDRFKFTSLPQRYIILRTAEGASIAEIVRELRQDKMPMDKHTITHIIRRFEHDTGVREWPIHMRYPKRK